MKEILYVFLGGGIGSVLRFSSTRILFSFFNNTIAGTFVSNLLACVILGFFSNLLLEKTIENPTIRPLLLIGLCGGFSTFSTFSFELLEMIKNGNLTYSIIYTIMSLLLCTVAILLGIYFSKYLI